MYHDLGTIPKDLETMDWSCDLFVCHMTLEQWPGHVTFVYVTCPGSNGLPEIGSQLQKKDITKQSQMSIMDP